MDIGPNSLFVAALATAVLATSSAFVLRSKKTVQAQELVQEHRIDEVQEQPSLSPQECQPKDSKTSRSKDRRRRGKDPLKELTKAGKKGKAPPVASPVAVKSPSSTVQSSPNTDTSGTVSSAPQEVSSVSSRSPSLVPQKSVSLNVDIPPPDVANSSVEQGVPPEVDSNPSPDSPLSSLTLTLESPSTAPSSDIDTHSLDSPSQSLSASPPPPSKVPGDTRRTSNPTQKHNSTWDWDMSHPPPSPHNVHHTHTHAQPSETTYQKPPRFRSQSRVSSSGSISPMPTPVSYNILYPTTPTPSSSSCSPISSPPRTFSPPSGLQNLDPSIPFAFPTLNPPSPSPSSTSSTNTSPPSNRYLNPPIFISNPPASARRASTPRRTTTPSPNPNQSQSYNGNSNVNSSTSGASPVSWQTQNASLRGALEAARMREEKTRAEAEHYAKECEMLRWRWGEDSAAWKRKEAELQTQIYHLMQQLQAYTTAFALSASPSSSPSTLSTSTPMSNPNVQLPYIPHATSPTSQSPQQYFIPPTTMPMMAMPAVQRHSHAAYAGQTSAGPSVAQQNNLLSLLFPPSGSVDGESPVAGPASGSVDWERGRPRMEDGGVEQPVEQVGSDWVGMVVGDIFGGGGVKPNELGVGGIGVENDGEVNEVLAGAILKRPGSIMVKSVVKPEKEAPGEGEEGEQGREDCLAEFTFPSIADGGVVTGAGSGREGVGESRNGDGSGMEVQRKKSWFDDAEEELGQRLESGPTDDSSNAEVPA